jgi:hypothetical protein
VTDKTATQNLTRTQSTDDPERLAEYIKSLATDADQRMTAQFFDLDRAVNPPFALLRLTIPVTLDSTVLAAGAAYTASIPFDTVQADTAGLADLSSSQYQIQLTETGWWWVGGYLLCTGFAASGPGDTTIIIRANSNAVSDGRHDHLTGSIGGSPSMPVRVTSLASVAPVSLTINTNGSTTRNTTTVLAAEMWAVKMRDL